MTAPADPFFTASTTQSASCPFELKTFCPLIRQPPSTRVAVVEMPRKSLLPSGSVIPTAPMALPFDTRSGPASGASLVCARMSLC